MEKVMIDTTEYQQRVLECIGSEEVDKFFGTTMFMNLPESSMCKQAMIHGKETLDLAPADRTDIIQECKYRIEVLSQFAPKMMTEEEIEAIIAGVLSDLGIENPTKKEKGKIMKTLMPMVKGKADGKLVNQILEKKLA